MNVLFPGLCTRAGCCALALLISWTPFFEAQQLAGGQQTDPPIAAGAGNSDLPQADALEPQATVEPDPFPLTELPPLKRLVLYNSGVGQLQHGGLIDGNARLEIKFGGHDVDDVLKSLVFSDSGDGSARAVEYKPAPDPEDVAAQIVGAPMTLAQLLQRFRGERASLFLSGSTIRGTIYGVENRSAGDQVVETVVLIHEDGLQSIALPEINRVHFDKQSLREELDQAMAGLVKSRKANQKQLDLMLEGRGQRDVEFAYVVDMPIWRMTYRLSVRDEQVYLQGWAHVDNVTGVDWKQVTMELRSGRPQAYHANVFAPLMAERPALGNSVYDFTSGLTLVTQWFGLEPSTGGGGWGFAGGSDRFGGGGGGLGGGGFGDPFSEGRSRNTESEMDIETAFRNSASEGRAAQMVKYVIDKPVDLGAGRSAALPVFANELPARLLTVCDELDDGMPPVHAVEFTNTTGLPIVSGPVSVLREGDFVGDGKLGRLAVNEKTEVTYGIDRAVLFERVGEKHDVTLENLRVAERLVVLSGKYVESRVYKIVNEDTEPREVVLYCPQGEKPRAVVTPQPDRQDEQELRFVVPVEPQSSRELTVVFSSPHEEKQTLFSVTQDDLDEWVKIGVRISDTDLEFFHQLFAIMARISAVRDESQLQNKKRDTLLAEQSRMRENVQALASNPEAAQSFVDKLLQMEREMEALMTLQDGTESRLNALLQEQEQFIEAYQE